MTPDQLTLPDVAAWRAWLDANENSSDGVWLTLAKKGTQTPTNVTYAQALEEALCSGWIDGRKNAIDDATYRQHFTPRRARSTWSKRNVELAEALTASGRMRGRGRVEIARAQADGRWERAYPGAAAMDVPADFRAALRDSPGAEAAFLALDAADRYSILLKVVTAPSETTRTARIARHMTTLATPAPRRK